MSGGSESLANSLEFLVLIVVGRGNFFFTFHVSDAFYLLPNGRESTLVCGDSGRAEMLSKRRRSAHHISAVRKSNGTQAEKKREMPLYSLDASAA